MPTVTIVTGVLLALLGIGSYFATGQASITALIPAFFGVPLAILGALARDEKRLKTAMHIAAALGLVGFLGGAPGLFKLPALLWGQEVARPAAVKTQAAMAAILGVFVALCVKSFIDARRRRRAA